MGWDRETEGFWTDRSDAAAYLNKKMDKGLTEQDKKVLQQFIDQGVAVLPKALSEEQIDAVLKDMQTVSDTPEHFFIRQKRKLKHPTKKVVQRDKFRFIDFHVNSAAAQSVMLSEPITHFLSLLFESRRSRHI